MVSKTAAAPVKEAVEKPIGGKNNGEKRIVHPKPPKYYPAEDIPVPYPSARAHNHKKTKLRSSITPGVILIILSGVHRGKRVIFLKQLDSGLLLVTGPFCINGCPLRRVNSAYVLPTKKTIDVSGVDVSKFDDKYFKTEKKVKSKGTEEEFMEVEEAEKKPKISEAKIADQKAVDSELLAVIKKEALLKAYLKSKFTLSKNQYPHLMVF